MGTLRSDTDVSGLIVNEILLGTPIFDETVSAYKWDHEAFPTGTIDASGTIVEDLP